MRLARTLLLCGFCLPCTMRAQQPDPILIREVSAVREELARNRAALGHYTWSSVIEVSVKGDVESAKTYKCRYDQNGEFQRMLVETGKDMQVANGVSKRPRVRSKADMQDYIERAMTRIYKYVPPDPEQINFLLNNGNASLGMSRGNTSEVRFRNYFDDGDILVFTYNSVSKNLLSVRVASTLGTPKDPVTLEAQFEPLPEGINHVSSATLNAPAKKVQMKLRNFMYEKVTN